VARPFITSPVPSGGFNELFHTDLLASKFFDLGTSALTLLVFLVPVAVRLMGKRLNRSSR
jgi:hypothetical protein